MAQSTVDANGNLLIDPGTYVTQNVISSQSNIGTASTLTIVGEAAGGPAYDQLSDPSQVAFTPDQLNNAIQMFGSGNLIDAFRMSISANADPTISGSINLIYLVKTNTSTAASIEISRQGLGNYAELQALLSGVAGNLISEQNTTSQQELPPTVPNVGLFLSPTLTDSLLLRVNGSSTLTASISTLPASMPTDLASPFEAFAAEGVLAQGGVPRGVLPGGSPTVSVAPVSGNLVATISSGAWGVNPVIGDVLLITSNGSLAGAGNANVGSYIVLSATSTTITATPVNITGSIVAVSGGAQGTGSTLALESFSPITISNATGVNRNILMGVTGTLTSSNFTSSQVTLSLNTGVQFSATPQVGELVYVPTTFIGVVNGWYQILTVVNTSTGSLTLSRLSNGALTSSPGSIAASPSQLQSLKSDIDGVGKSLEIIGDTNSPTIIKDTSNGDPLEVLNSLVTSAAEREVQTLITKPAQNNPITNTFVSGGDIVLQIGYNGASCAMTITDTMLTTTCSNAANNLSISLASYPTLATLVSYINTQQNYTASVGSAKFNYLSPVLLDNVTTDIATSIGALPGRIKNDANEWFNNLSQSSLVSVVSPGPSSGLPDNELSSTFLTGGLVGGTTGADVVGAIDECQIINTNFLITAFDSDATADIANGKTDPSSTYTIDAINAYAKAHVIEMSTVLERKNRMAFVAKYSTTLAIAEQASQELAHPRVALSWFQIKDVNSSGQIALFPAWGGSCKAAGQSAAAGYKGIVSKYVNISGVVYPSDFDPRRYGDRIEALEAGLLIIRPVVSGGFTWVSDQTTYSADNNFVYNSIQAQYLADLMTLTLIADGDRVLIGKAVSQASASIVRGFMQTEMATFLRLNWITVSDDAPLGYKNLTVQLNGGVINISIDVRLNGIIYFASINLNLGQAVQTA